MGKCAKTKGKARKLECYARSSAKWTAGKLKSGVERIGRFSGEQGSKHKYGFGLFFLVVIGCTFLVGGYFLLTAPISNPDASQVSYVRTYTLSNGTIVEDNRQISGVLKCVVQPSAGAITEPFKVVTVGVIRLDRIYPIPYWIQNVLLRIYSGSSTSGALVRTAGLTAASTTYASTMQTWANNFWNLIENNAINPNAWLLGPTPADNPAWSVGIDTRGLPNGVYTFQVVIVWGLGATGVPWGVSSMITPTIPALPPSLSSSGGEAKILSMFGIGLDVPILEAAIPAAFIVIVAVAVAVVLYLKRR